MAQTPYDSGGSRKIKRTDNALTIPGRTTFPRGTYVPKPPTLPGLGSLNSGLNRTPYGQAPGTQASGVAGALGAPFAMNPVGYNPAMRGRGFNSAAPAPTTPGVYTPTMQWRGYQAPRKSVYPYQGTTDDSWYSPVEVSATAPAPPLQPGQFVNPQGVVQQGATPFGTNAYGERLDASGDVWTPETATTDIYGGRFIQKGAVTWERNRAGRLIKVQHLGGGKTRVVAGGSKQKNKQTTQPVPQQSVQETVSLPSIANAFVSFRS